MGLREKAVRPAFYTAARMDGPCFRSWRDDGTVDVGEAIVATGVAIGQPGVVETEEVEDRGVEVVDMDDVAGDVDPMLVGGPVRHPPLHTTACQPG